MICVFLCLCFWYTTYTLHIYDFTLIAFLCSLFLILKSSCWNQHLDHSKISVRSKWHHEQQNEMKASNVLIVSPVFLLISHVPVSSCQVMSHLHPINSNSCILGRLFEKCGTSWDNHMVRCDPLSLEWCKFMYSYTINISQMLHVLNVFLHLA